MDRFAWMLEPAISRRSRVRWKTLASALVVGCGVAYVWVDRPAEPALIIHLPAYPVVITVPSRPTVIIQPAPAPPAPAPAPPPVPAPITQTTCPLDVATIGVPVAPENPQPQNVNAPPFVGVAVSRDGCTLAARAASAIEISWDSGQTFARHDVGELDSMVAVGTHVLVQRTGELGRITPGDSIAWRSVPVKLAKSRLLAAGRWTVLVTDGLAGVSEDKGQSWRYLDIPADLSIERVDADGRVFATRTNIVVPFDGEGNGRITTTHLAADVLHPKWQAVTTHAGRPADDTGRYALEPDEFWGCGGSEKLAWLGARSIVASSLRTEVWPLAVHTAGNVTFATLQNQLVRLDRAKRIDVGDIPGQLVGVDARGTAIVQTGTQVLRWSKAGGWRVLLDSR